MKNQNHWWMATLAGVTLTGCVSPHGNPNYTGSGVLAGSATGALIGSMARNHGAGALIGAAAGAVVGGLVGHGMDKAQEERLRKQSPQTLTRIEQGDPLTVLDVKALIQAGISDDLIISQIRNSRTIYHLSAADIIDLTNSGASEGVIDFMINTPTQLKSSAVVAVAGSSPPAPLYEPIVVAPSPDYVWIGGSWIWIGDHWSWRRGYWHCPRPLGPRGGPRP
jgi:hypothetical protein